MRGEGERKPRSSWGVFGSIAAAVGVSVASISSAAGSALGLQK